MNKTPQEQMKFIVEQTDGECWHSFKPFNGVGGFCIYCDVTERDARKNPSSKDLNELFRLAEKNGFDYILIHKNVSIGGYRCLIRKCHQDMAKLSDGSTKEDALRLALFTALGGDDE